MNVDFSGRAIRDYQSLPESERAKVDRLIEAILEHPFTGIGKPEPLKGILAGLWSRRITIQHRLVYRVTGSGDSRRLEIVACRTHYDGVVPGRA
ncbi:MAG: Txe/YoeB family addiction module toxin [Microvirga sp.]